MRFFSVYLSIITGLLLNACGGSNDQSQTSDDDQSMPPVVEVIAADYAFQAPDTISSGWTTLRLVNEQGMEIHELGLAKLPDGKNMGDYLNEIMPPWDSALLQVQNGEIESTEMGSVAYDMLPQWNSEIQYVKSRGLISAGYQTENIMYLDPGTYLIECWVKNAEGEIHISRGMIRPLTVVDTGNDASAPDADYEMSLTAEGIETSEELTAGRKIFSVDFELDENDQLIYDDVHLIKVNDDTDLAQVANWLPWYQAGGLRAPAPAEFLGGADVYGSLPHGEKAYFSIDVQPGRYAWIVAAPVEEQVWQEFTVDSGN